MEDCWALNKPIYSLSTYLLGVGLEWQFCKILYLSQSNPERYVQRNVESSNSLGLFSSELIGLE